MDRCTDRWKVAKDRIDVAGFSNVVRISGVDAVEDPKGLADAWKLHGSPAFDRNDTEFVTYPGKQGCMLSHLAIWKRMIDERIDVATILEDDVRFHSQWDALAPSYWKSTPKDFDILFMGSQMDMYQPAHIIRVPVFCTHAYVLTLAGARKLYNLLVKCPNGVRTIDCMMIDHMKASMNKLPASSPFQWYVWNGLSFRDEWAFRDKDWGKRNTGLVFQDPQLGTYVRPW